MSLFARLAHYSSEPQFIDVLVLNYMKLHQNLCKHPPVQDVHVGYKLEISSSKTFIPHLGNILINATGCLLRPLCSSTCLNMQDLCVSFPVHILARMEMTQGGFACSNICLNTRAFFK